MASRASAAAAKAWRLASGRSSGKIASMPSPMNFRISPSCRSTGSDMASKYSLSRAITSSRGQSSEMAVKPRRSQIRITAFTVAPLPRVIDPRRISSLACGPT